MIPAEPRPVALLGEQQPVPPLAAPLQVVDGGAQHGTRRGGHPPLGAERGGGVLVDVPHDGPRPHPAGERHQQLGVVEEDHVGVGGVLGEGPVGGAQGPEAAPSGGARHVHRAHLPPRRRVARPERGYVRDFMAGVEQRAYLPVQNARVLGVMHHRANADPHLSHSVPKPLIGTESGRPMEIADEFRLSATWPVPGVSSAMCYRCAAFPGRAYSSSTVSDWASRVRPRVSNSRRAWRVSVSAS